MKFVNPSDSAAMKRLLEALRNAQPTYSDLGATLVGGRPKGFHHGRYTSDLGHGHATFQRAVEGLRAWDAHRLPGAQVFPEGQEIQTGATVVVTFGTPSSPSPYRAGSWASSTKRPVGALPTGRCPAIPNGERRHSSSRYPSTRRCSSRLWRSPVRMTFSSDCRAPLVGESNAPAPPAISVRFADLSIKGNGTAEPGAGV